MLVYHFEGVPRNPVTVALKNILTLGIHTKVWLYRINREMDGHEGFHIDLRWLGVMLALPIITPVVVKFQTVRRLNKMVAHQVTVPILRSRYLGWASLVPVVGQALYAGWVQGTLNKHWFWHRREERIRLAKDRIKRIAAEPETAETLERRFQAEAEIREMEQEIQAEIDATEIRLGPDRWKNRLAYAERMGSGGRMSRKDLALMRERDKKARKAEKVKRKAERGRLFGLLPPKTATPDADARDPDNDADWAPSTPLPARSPDEIRAPAESEGRELTDEEQAEIKAAQKLVAKREKEAQRLAKARDKLRKAREKARLKAEKDEEKARAQKEKDEEKARLLAERKKAKAASKPAKETKGKKAKDKAKDEGKGKGVGKGKDKGKHKRRRKGAPADEAPPERIPVTPRRYKAPPQVHESGEGPLRTLNITCPRCKSQIEGIQKRGEKPAKVTCPNCQLVGKV